MVENRSCKGVSISALVEKKESGQGVSNKGGQVIYTGERDNNYRSCELELVSISALEDGRYAGLVERELEEGEAGSALEDLGD